MVLILRHFQTIKCVKLLQPIAFWNTVWRFRILYFSIDIVINKTQLEAIYLIYFFPSIFTLIIIDGEHF